MRTQRAHADAPVHEDVGESLGKVGGRTLTAGLAVQRKGGGGGDAGLASGQDPFALHRVAEQGIAGSGGALPHLDAIQRSFGPGHDVSQIRAHTDGAASQATGAMGAAGYATGNDVAFAGSPDLHLAAHEAAHVVQQRAGVQLAGGVGEVGDSYERNADEVADRVVAGQSAADLLPAGAGGGDAGVQHKKRPAAVEKDEDDDDLGLEGEDPALEADEGEEAGSTNKPLVEGKPPGAVQQRQLGPVQHKKPTAKAARAKRLTIQQATARYAPLVYLAPGEVNGPSDASEYIESSSLRWSHDSGRSDHEIAGRGEVNQTRLGDGGYQHQVEGRITGHHGDQIQSNDNARPKDGSGEGGNEGFFLDLNNSKRGSLGANGNAPVYHEAVNQRYITYWFFYAYNSGPTSTTFDNHEGDWERIVVKLDRRNRATHVAYYAHNGEPAKKTWSAAPKQGSHPLVYSAKGSHASHATPGKHKSGFPGVNDTTGKGRQWKTWNNLKSAKAQGWYGYGGAWGEVGNIKDTTGPQGPSAHKAPAPKGW